MSLYARFQANGIFPEAHADVLLIIPRVTFFVETPFPSGNVHSVTDALPNNFVAKLGIFKLALAKTETGITVLRQVTDSFR